VRNNDSAVSAALLNPVDIVLGEEVARCGQCNRRPSCWPSRPDGSSDQRPEHLALASAALRVSNCSLGKVIVDRILDNLAEKGGSIASTST
jgi:hypothetical protein